MKLRQNQLKEFLDEKVEKYNSLSFIETDPISIPHQFKKKEDREVAGFLAATIAWGQRKSIIANGNKLIQLMDFAPYDFVMNAKAKDYKAFESFKHRTFNGTDCIFFLKSLKNIYKKHNGIEAVFSKNFNTNRSIKEAIINFRSVFLEIEHPSRTTKHISNPAVNSAAKRINMYLRWMVRKDKKGVDFGIWKSIPASALYIPLDVHSGNVARKLGLLQRKQNDWKAVDELTEKLKSFDSHDPIKYDFALFGLGAFEKF